jgi:hypothetical protein
LSRTKHRLRIIFLTVSALALIAAGAIYLFSRTAGDGRRSRELRLEALLAETDYEISLGYYEKALDGLERALSEARGEYGSLRVLKRAYQISYDLNDFSILNGFARDAFENIPGSTALAEIYLYAAIRSDSRQWLEELKKLLRRSRGDLSYLQAEAYLRRHVDTVPQEVQDPRLQKILALLPQGDAAQADTARPYTAGLCGARLDPYQLQRLGAELDEPRVHLDAALLWMGRGDADSAYTLVSRYAADPLFEDLFAEPGIFISYDAGYEREALSLMQQRYSAGGTAGRADLIIMQGDLNLVLGRNRESLRLYQEAIASHPAYSWTPYLNVARIAEQEGNWQTARIFRERAYRRFPDVGSVVVCYAGTLSRFGNREDASAILQSYLQSNEDDHQAQLLFLELENTAASPAVYQAALWELYNRHPESRMLCEHLFLYLLEFNDLSGAEAALRHYQLATGRTEEPWLLDYRAILEAARGNYAEATRLLQDRLAREDSCLARINLAVLLGRARQPEEAVRQLIEAEHLLPQERRQFFRSRIRSRIGEQYLLLGDVAAARRECEFAIDLDRSNFHAHRILRILEGR